MMSIREARYIKKMGVRWMLEKGGWRLMELKGKHEEKDRSCNHKRL